MTTNDESDSDRLMSQALPVSNFPISDLKAPPATGEEYLHRVRFVDFKCSEIY
jgi:hypothetical protein